MLKPRFQRLLVTTLAMLGVVLAPAATAQTTLNLLYFDLPYLRGLQELLPEFTAQTGIDVQFEMLSETAAYQKIQVELAANSDNYDIIGTQSSFLPLFVQNQWLTPVDTYFGTSASDPSVLDIDDFVTSTLLAMSSDDTQYCLPFFAATIILYYRLDIFEQHGIESPPATFDELLEVAEKVHTPEVPAIALRGLPTVAGNIWHWNLFLYGEGGRYFESFPDDLTPMIDSEESIRAATIFTTLKRNFSPEGAANYSFDDVVIAMQQGRVAMVIEGAPLAGRIVHPEQSLVVGKVGFAVVPGGPAGRYPAFASHGLCIPATAKNPEAAYRFLEWATSADVINRVALNTTHLAVTRNTVWQDADFIDKYDFDFGGGSFLQAFQESLRLAPPDYYPPFPGWPRVGERVGQALQQVEVGRANPRDALTAAARDVRDILLDLGYRLP